MDQAVVLTNSLTGLACILLCVCLLQIRRLMQRSAWSLPPDDEFGAERIAAAQASHRARLAAIAPRTHTHPAPRNFSHLSERRKKAEVAFERASEIEHSNLLLVQRLRMILARKQIDNVPSVMSQLPRSLNRTKRTAELTDIVRENARIFARISHTAPRVPRAAKVAREAQELEAVISRHCERPRLDPLAFQQTYFADERNPFLNFSGGKIKVTHAATHGVAEEKHEDATTQQQLTLQQQQGAHGSQPGAMLLKPTRPPSAAPPRHAASARPGSARPTQPTHVAQDPLLLARPVSARFRPLRMEQNPIALAKHVAALQAQAAAANHARRPPRPASAAAIAASHSARAAQSAAAAATVAASDAPAPPHLLFEGPWLISGRMTNLRMHEYSEPWRLELVVTNLAAPAAGSAHPQQLESSPPPAPTEYTLLLESAQLAPFFAHVPDIFSGSARSRSILVNTLKDSLKFVRTAELAGSADDAGESGDADGFELCVDLVQSAPKPQSPRVGSVMQEFEAVKRAAAYAREQEQRRHEQSAAEKLRSNVAAKPWSIQELTAMLPPTDVTAATVTPAPAAASAAASSPSPAPALSTHLSSTAALTPSPSPLPLRATPPLHPQPVQSLPSPSLAPSPPPPLFVIPTHHARHSRFQLNFTPAAAPAASVSPSAAASAESASSVLPR